MLLFICRYHLHPPPLRSGPWGLVGATPDGILKFPNGTLVVVEVKNHAPFQTPKQRQRNRRSTSRSHGDGDGGGNDRHSSSSSASSSPSPSLSPPSPSTPQPIPTLEVYDRGPMESIGAWHIPQV
jgi:hypothetical protein